MAPTAHLRRSGTIPLPLAMPGPLLHHRPHAAGGGAFWMVVLLAINVSFAVVPPGLELTTLVFVTTAVLALYLLISGRFAIPPLLDVGFVFAALFYYGMPGLFYLTYPHHDPVPTLPLQQALVGCTVATLYVARYALRWRSWARFVERKNEAVTAPLGRAMTMALIAVALLWIAVALPGLSRYVAMEYGTRQVEQRSDMTIPLLGFDMFALVGMALLTERLLRSPRRRLLWIAGFLAFAVYGIVMVFIVGTRTKLIWALILPSVAALNFQRIRFRTLMVVAAAVFALLPVFDLIGRARLTFHNEDPSLESLREIKVGSTLEQLAANSEMVGMVGISDRVIHGFGDEVMFGRYIGWSILQAPPGFLLRPVGLETTHSLAGRYTETFFPTVWRRGGAFGLALSGESWCNFRELGGVFSGLILVAFIVFFERAILPRVPYVLGLALAADFLITVARINRGGLESIPKPMAVSFVMLLVIWMCQAVAARRTPRLVPGSA